MSVVPTQTAQLTPSPMAGEGKKAQLRQLSKYNEVRKFLNAYYLLMESAPCTAQTLAGIHTLMAVTYKMPNNVAKVLNHITKALQHIEQQNQNGDSATSMSELMKDLWINLSAEMDTVKEIGQGAESLKASINNMGNSLAQVTDTSTPS
ncbi:hypothetical protein V8E53_003606 [Lactarius tabidus]